MRKEVYGFASVAVHVGEVALAWNWVQQSIHLGYSDALGSEMLGLLFFGGVHLLTDAAIAYRPKGLTYSSVPPSGRETRKHLRDAKDYREENECMRASLIATHGPSVLRGVDYHLLDNENTIQSLGGKRGQLTPDGIGSASRVWFDVDRGDVYHRFAAVRRDNGQWSVLDPELGTSRTMSEAELIKYAKRQNVKGQIDITRFN